MGAELITANGACAADWVMARAGMSGALPKTAQLECVRVSSLSESWL